MPHAKCGTVSGAMFVGGETMAMELKVVMDPAVGVAFMGHWAIRTRKG
jgi:hypothetical protein